MRTDEGVVIVRRLCKNANLPIGETSRTTGHDWVAAQAIVIQAQGKVLVKTGLSTALPLGCYGKIVLDPV